MTKSDCRGCHDDFYNHGGMALDGKQCWSFDAKKPLKVRFYIHRDSPMGEKCNYEKRRVPECWHPQIGAMLDKIPSYAK